MASNRNKVPKAVYQQCVWIVKDMDRLRGLEAAQNYTDIDNELIFFVNDEGVIRNSEVLAQAKHKLECIRHALEALPEEYRKPTIESIVYCMNFDHMAHENTWRKWKQVFIKELATNLMLI